MGLCRPPRDSVLAPGDMTSSYPFASHSCASVLPRGLNTPPSTALSTRLSMRAVLVLFSWLLRILAQVPVRVKRLVTIYRVSVNVSRNILCLCDPFLRLGPIPRPMLGSPAAVVL